MKSIETNETGIARRGITRRQLVAGAALAAGALGLGACFGAAGHAFAEEDSTAPSYTAGTYEST